MLLQPEPSFCVSIAQRAGADARESCGADQANIAAVEVVVVAVVDRTVAEDADNSLGTSRESARILHGRR